MYFCNSLIKSKFSIPRLEAFTITLLTIVPGDAIPINSISFNLTPALSITLLVNSTIISTKL